jgi:hypothetical protein
MSFIRIYVTIMLLILPRITGLNADKNAKMIRFLNTKYRYLVDPYYLRNL